MAGVNKSKQPKKKANALSTNAHIAKLSDYELSQWAEQSSIATTGNLRIAKIGICVFWLLVVVVLFMRFFLMDPEWLNPSETASPADKTSSRPK